MVVIGSISVKDDLGVVHLRGNIKSTTNLLGLSTMEATKMTLFITETATRFLTTSETVMVRLRLSGNKNVRLSFVISANVIPNQFSHTPLERFFTKVELSKTETRGTRLMLEYQLPDDAVTISEKLVKAIRTAFLRKSETQLLDELSRKNEELVEKNKELQQFAYIASHDLQEPLRTIVSFSEILYEDYIDKLDEEGKENLQFILEASERMRALVLGLLDHSRIGREIDFKEVDCNELIADIISDLSSTIDEVDVVFDFENLPVVIGSKPELRTLFQNLISNAIKFRKKEGTLRVSVTAKKEEEHWHFTIADNGIGMEEKYLERIFLIFKRLHTQDEYKGTGIGLAHCRKVTDIHNGKIWATSKFGEGSEFHFTLPITQL